MAGENVPTDPPANVPVPTLSYGDQGKSLSWFNCSMLIYSKLFLQIG